VASVEIDPDTGKITVRADVSPTRDVDAAEKEASKALDKWLDDQPD
jgi:hypothetical protein